MKVLIIEDEPTIHKCYQGMFEDLGWLVESAYSISEAKEKIFGNLLSDYIDLIIMDLMLPGGRGDDFAQNIRNGSDKYAWNYFNLSMIPILAITAMPKNSIRNANAFNDIIEKPTTTQKIEESTHKLVATWRSDMINEFDLFNSDSNRIFRIASGGEDGLNAAMCGAMEFRLGDEREHVCLVDAYLAGMCSLYADKIKPYELLLKIGCAGTKKSANTLLNVGRSVGKHFSLLDKNNLPTKLFTRFFGDELNDFRDAILKHVE